MNLTVTNTPALPVSTLTLKSGAESVKPLSRVEFRKSKGLTNSEAKRLYPAYLLDLGRANNGIVAKALADGTIVVTGHTVNASTGTGTLKFMRADHKSLVLPAPKAPKGTDVAAEKIAKAIALLRAAGISETEIAAL